MYKKSWDLEKMFGFYNNKNITYQNSWDAVKAIVCKKLIAFNILLKKDNLKVNWASKHKILQYNFREYVWKERVKIGAEIYEMKKKI